jgi:predicted GNAT family N-acyltransferase
MTEQFPPTIELLNKHHNRSGFLCGESLLDDYLRQYAKQDAKRRISRIFVATFPGSRRVAGYYTLSATSFMKSDLPAQQAKKLPQYPVPAAIIGRLAVDQKWQGTGLGRFLLVDALDRILKASMEVGVFAVIVDAKSETAKKFYEAYGFKAFGSQPLRLFLPLETLQAI